MTENDADAIASMWVELVRVREALDPFGVRVSLIVAGQESVIKLPSGVAAMLSFVKEFPCDNGFFQLGRDFMLTREDLAASIVPHEIMFNRLSLQAMDELTQSALTRGGKQNDG